MRILHTVPNGGWAGREARMLETAQWQQHNGHDVWIAAPAANQLHRRAADAGIPILHLPHRGRALGDTLQKISRYFAIDVIDAHGAGDSIAAAAMPFASVHTRHRMALDGDFAGPHLAMWRDIGHVIACAAAIAQELAHHIHVPGNRISVVGEWAAPRFFDAPDAARVERARAALKLQAGAPVIAMITMLRGGKGVDVLLDSIGAIRKEIPAVHALIIGDSDAGNHEIERLQERLRKEDLARSVTLTGFRDDVDVLLRIADVIAVPSLKDAQTRVIPEAFAAGVPVVASEVGGIPELLKNDVTGWLVPPNDAAALAAKMVAVLSRPDVRMTVARQAQALARTALGQDGKMHATLAAYEAALERRPRRVRIASAQPHRDRQRPFLDRHVMVVAAHPDDETIGAGVSLCDAARVSFVHVTDGAWTEKMAQKLGFPDRPAYAEARRRELKAALAGIRNKDFTDFGLRDQTAAYHISEIAMLLRGAIERCAPDVVLTHAYEGGHPDHDATAMAVHLVLRSLDHAIPHYEMALYNRAGGEKSYGTFAARADAPPVVRVLSPEEQARRRAMLDAFASQRSVVAKFPLQTETVRPAPFYDFLARPHGGTLYYERNAGPMSPIVWRWLAWRAARAYSRGANPFHGWDRLIGALAWD